MKTSLKNIRTILAVTLGSISAVALLSITRAAGTSSFIMTPSSGSYKVGDTIKVNVSIQTSDNINVVSAAIAYDSTKLDFLSANYTDSAFSLSANESDNGNTITIDRATSGGNTVTGTVKFAELTFNVLASSGTGTLTFAPSSAIVAGTPNSTVTTNTWNESSSGASFSFTSTTPPTTPPPTTPPPSDEPTTPPPTTPPPSDVAQPNPAQQVSNAGIPDDQPVPVGSSQGPRTNLVAIKVVDNEGNPRKNVDVTINEQTEKTDDNGIANFIGLPKGKYTVSVLGESYEITVDDDQSGEVQSYTFGEDTGSVDIRQIALYTTLAAAGIGLLIVVANVLKQRAPAKIISSYTTFKTADTPPNLNIQQPSTPVQNSDPADLLDKINTDKPQPSTIIKPTEKN